MGPGDNDMSFKTDVFNGDNFSCWKFRITHVFKAAGLWEIVSGKETWDLDSKDFDGRKAFNRRSSKAFLRGSMRMVRRAVRSSMCVR